jgi:hypothetical protein
VTSLEANNLLRSLLGSYLRAAVGSMRTSTEELKVTPCQDSLNLVLTGAARITAHRLKRQEEWRKFRVGHAKLDFLQKHPFTSK